MRRGETALLLVDMQRIWLEPGLDPDHRDSLAENERRRRAALMFQPFQKTVADALSARLAEGRPTRIVAVHSFTSVFLGVRRPWHAGVLFALARSFGERTLARLAADPSLNVAANVPYEISRQEDYTVPVHGDDRNIPALLIEIRHDLIDRPAWRNRSTVWRRYSPASRLRRHGTATEFTRRPFYRIVEET